MQIFDNRNNYCKSFYAYEIEGRNKLATALPHIKWNFTEPEFSTYDAYVSVRDKEICVEIKTRTFESYQFDTCFLEVDKLFRMRQETQFNTLVYVAHYTNNKTAFWNLENIDITKFQPVRCPDSTANYNETKFKDIINLPLDQAQWRYTDSGEKTQQFKYPL
ncbi:hypothetical protein [Sphingobacterium chungjuense]|uniref:hypothetical protein n=1 Tax=Sphingobacterium chungjuense TaxID=2675553 RepID=UPI00140D75FF|nr:hypothetical protein [Sphingobacterium chungjuense]